MVVDDIAANRNLLRETLEPHGCEVLLAGSGETALKFAARSGPDIILLDINMPEMSGYEVCKRLKQDGKTAGIPVLFISANDATQSLVEGFRAGGVDYVTKPFKAEEVLIRLETHVRVSRLTRALESKNEELTRLNTELQTQITERHRAEQSLHLIEHSSLERFHVGGTLRHDAPSYVLRRADNELLDGLLRGRFCYVLTSRQMGKSSLMVRAAHQLRNHGCTVLTLDLTAMGQNVTPDQWYGGLLGRIGRQLDMEDSLDDFWLSRQTTGPCQRFFSALSEKVLPQLQGMDKNAGSRQAGQSQSSTGRLVIFVDEIDMVRSLPFPTAEFFAAIRESYNRRSEDSKLDKLDFAVFGVASPAELIQDSRMTPFQIGQRIELQDFSFEDAEPLSHGLGRDPVVGRKLLERAFFWTSGHPYLTQKLCKGILEHTSIQTPEDLDDLCKESFFTSRSVEQDDNLVFVRDRICRAEANRRELLNTYSRIRSGERVPLEDGDPTGIALRLSGIVQTSGNYLAVRNRIYENVFNPHWVQATLGRLAG